MRKHLLIHIPLLLLSLCIALGMTVTAEAADSGTCGEHVTWTLEDDGTLTISGTGEMFFELALYEPWGDDDLVRAIHVEDGVTSICRSAFSGCENLTEVTLGGSLVSIGEGAFWMCTSLPSIHIPAAVAEIGNDAFYGCESLREITVDAESPAFSSVDGVLFDRDKTQLLAYPADKPDAAYTIPNTVTSIAENAIYGADHLRSLTVPGSVKTVVLGYYQGLTALKEVILQEGVEAIGEDAFAGCNALEEVQFPETTLRSIGAHAFYDTGLKSAILPDSVESLEMASFAESGVKEVRIPPKVTVLPESVFRSCNMESVTVPGNVKKIDLDAFLTCGALKTVVLEEGVETIDYDAFSGCDSLETVRYGGTAESWWSIRNLSLQLLNAKVYDRNGQVIQPRFTGLEDVGTCGKHMVWYYCSDGTLIIRGSGAMDDYSYRTDITYDQSGVRRDTSYYTYPWNQYGDAIQTVKIGEGVERIGNMAFSDIETLKNLYVPVSLRQVAYGAFHGSGLTDVYYTGTQTQWSGVAKGQYNEPLLTASLHDWIIEPDPPAAPMELKAQNGLQFTLTLNLTEDARLCVAWYDQNERFLGCTMETVGAGDQEFVCNDARNGAKTGKVILTGQDLRPLCPGIPVSD